MPPMPESEAHHAGHSGQAHRTACKRRHRRGALSADSGGETAAHQRRQDQKGKAPAGDRTGRDSV